MGVRWRFIVYPCRPGPLVVSRHRRANVPHLLEEAAAPRVVASTDSTTSPSGHQASSPRSIWRPIPWRRASLATAMFTMRVLPRKRSAMRLPMTAPVAASRATRKVAAGRLQSTSSANRP